MYLHFITYPFTVMPTKADISFVRSLAVKTAREREGVFVVEGPKMVGEALRSSLRVRRIFAVERMASFPGAEITGEKEIDRMSSLRTPQGVVAVVELPRRDMPPELAGRLTLALDGVQDPGNVGTVIRTADWFGIRDIVCSPECADAFNPKTIQASMGGIFRVAVHTMEMSALIRAAAKEDVPTFGTFLSGEDIYRAQLPSHGIIFLGSEGNGISPEAEAAVGRRLHIPSAEGCGAESLNVATAAAIVCSEFSRRKQ